jgi:hypothetical protein
MEIAVKKTGSPVVVTLTTTLTPEMLRLCPNDCVLKDEKGNETFRVSEGHTSSIGSYSVTFVRGEGAKDTDPFVVNVTEEGSLKSVKEKYARYLEPLAAIEKQVAAAYKTAESNLAKIKEVD